MERGPVSLCRRGDENVDGNEGRYGMERCLRS